MGKSANKKNNLSLFIEQQLDNREEITDFVAKAKALASIGTTSDFSKADADTISDYFFTIEFLLEKILLINEQAVNILLKSKPNAEN